MLFVHNAQLLAKRPQQAARIVRSGRDAAESSDDDGAPAPRELGALCLDRARRPHRAHLLCRLREQRRLAGARLAVDDSWHSAARVDLAHSFLEQVTARAEAIGTALAERGVAHHLPSDVGQTRAGTGIEEITEAATQLRSESEMAIRLAGFQPPARAHRPAAGSAGRQ